MLMSKYDPLIAEIRKVGPTRPVVGDAHIMGNMAEFLAALAEDAAKQTEENLRLQRKLVVLTWVLAALTAALLAFTVVLYEDTHALVKREQLAEHHELEKPQRPPKP
jgi:hypothetical protein